MLKVLVGGGGKGIRKVKLVDELKFVFEFVL